MTEYKKGDKVIITSSREGYRGEMATVYEAHDDKLTLQAGDGYFIPQCFVDEVIPDRPVMLSEVTDIISRVADMKNDDGFYDYDEEFHPDDEYYGWHEALGFVVDKLIGEEKENV